MTAAALYGLVLAGGRSTRLGVDKAGLPWAGQTLLAHGMALLDRVCTRAFASIAPSQTQDPLRRQYGNILDLPCEQGPMAGLHAAQLAYPDVAWLLLAVDMPHVNEKVLKRLATSRDASRTATAFRCDRQVEPLCAIYEPSCQAAIASAMADDDGHRSLRRLLSTANVRWLAAPSATFVSANDALAWRRLQAGG